MQSDRKAHWNQVYGTRPVNEVSWYESTPQKSLEFIRAAAPLLTSPIIDAGAGASTLVDELVAEGYTDVTVVDISAEALERVRRRLGGRARYAHFIEADVTTLRIERRYALWHDRAVFHFLVDRDDRRRYVETLRNALAPGGQIVIATFGPEGPQRCSGLPVRRYSESTLLEELGPAFRLLDSVTGPHQTPAGAVQQFIYCRFSVSDSPLGS